MRLPFPCRVESTKHACAETPVTFNKPALYRLKAVDKAKGFTTVCNPVEVFAEDQACLDRRRRLPSIPNPPATISNAHVPGSGTCEIETLVKAGVPAFVQKAI
jgi:hypothetical protein